MRVKASVNEGARGRNTEMSYGYGSDGVGYMCCAASKGNVHQKVIKMSQTGYMICQWFCANSEDSETVCIYLEGNGY